MHGAKHMIKRAEYRKKSEEHLFLQVLQWAESHKEPMIVEIIQRALQDDNAERWLTLHPTSSFTGLSEHYFHVVAEERQLTGNERRLLKKRLDAYYKRLIG